MRPNFPVGKDRTGYMPLISRQNRGVKERILVSRGDVDEIEARISLESHVERYRFVRWFVSGNVLDIACGCGYGSYVLQKDPDVDLVVGVDHSVDTIQHAKEAFSTEKTRFISVGIQEFNYPLCFDYGISLETIEHLKDPRVLVDMFLRNKTEKIILSYPVHKSTHFNPHHYHDFKLDDVRRLFRPDYNIYDARKDQNEVMFVFLQKIR